VIREWARNADPRTIPGTKLPVVVAGLIGLLVAWEYAATPILLLEMRKDFGYDITFIATMGSVLAGVTLVFSPVMGYIADRIPRVWLLRLGALLGSVAVFGTATSHSIGTLLPARMLFSVAVVLTGGAAVFPLLSDAYPSWSRARVFAALGAAAQIGVIAGPLAAGPLASALGWRAAFLPFAAMWAIAALVTFRLREPIRGAMDRLEMGASEEAAARPQRPVSWSESWRAARSITSLRRLWYAMPFIYLGSAGAFQLMAVYFSDLFQLGPSGRSLIAAGSGVGAMTSVILFSPTVDRLLTHRPARVATLGGVASISQAFLFALLAMSPFMATSAALAIGISAIGAMLATGSYALLSLVTPARVRGLGIQTALLWQLPGFILAPQVIGWSQTMGVRRGMFVFVPLLAIGGSILASTAGGVAQDIRAARASAMADEEVSRSRAQGRDKMLIIRDVDVAYDGTQVLFGVNLDMAEGELIALLGTNGAGKSTLLRAIIGLQEASNGAIFVDGQDVTHAPPHENAQRGIVMVPGGRAVFPTLSVSENLSTAARAVGLGDAEARQRIEQVLELFPALRERSGAQAGNLSGGEQQMLALGQAFLARPRILMIDELSLGLAPAIVEQLVRTVRRIHAEGTTVVLVEQSINVALTIAERAVFMEKGEVRFDGKVADLMRRPDLIRAVFMGGALGGKPQLGASTRVTEEREPVLRAEGIVVRYGGVDAVRGVDVEAAPGEIVGLIGPNGAGKSTLFDAIAGHVKPDAGRVTLGGVDVTRMPADARGRAGLCRSFQTARLFGSLTVRECIAVAMERHLRIRGPLLAITWAPPVRAQERRVRRRVEALLHLLSLKSSADKFVSELSTGTRRALDIACIMAADPEVVLLDEPSSGLAQAETEALAPLLTRLVRETGCAMLVVEHDLPLVSSISDRLVAMDLGAVIAAGTPDAVLSDERVVSSYLAATEDAIQRSDLRNVRNLQPTK
jgi:ABC-type branched-subunit amino acid transport system ATPase component/predicted MFS family arabinose efflux permease